MGLDGVELVMDVEDHFGVAIQDVEAERIRTCLLYTSPSPRD